MKIAIQGHPTRGKEVIQILESLGGENRYDQSGSNDEFVYFINNIGFIYSVTLQMCSNERRIYTLEEFEKEFPFKIGDIVITLDYKPYKIVALEYYNNKMCYKLDNGFYYRPQILKLYKEMQEERNITLTLDKAKEWYKKGGELKEIALQAFTEKELNPLPRSWEEFIESIKFTFKGHLEYIDGIVHWSNSCFPNKSIGESSKVCDKHVALFQLEQLRNYWWGDWKPEWDCCEKHVIKWKKDDLIVFIATRVHAFLVFPTKEMAEEFLKCFKDLIEKAGDLI